MEEFKEEIIEENIDEVIEEVVEEIKSMYVLLNEDSRISMVTKDKQREDQFEFDLPSDFDFSGIANWKIADGELIYDKLIIPEEPKAPTTDEVLNALLGLEV